MTQQQSVLDITVPLGEESPLKQYYDHFDVEHIDWGATQYKINALQMPTEATTKMLVGDWKWKKDHGQNVVASIDGSQGTGKSMPFSYACLLLGNIFGVPFTVNDIYFTPDQLDDAIEHSKPCQTLFKDEDPKSRVGLMSHMLDANLTDYEEQLRLNQNNLLQAGVELRAHAHFYWFESKHIVFDAVGYPVAFYSMLKTPRYTDKKEFVWRGYVRFPMPNKDFVTAYLEKKQKHNEELKAKYGNTLNPVIYYAYAIFQKQKNNLIQRTREGFVVPLKRELMNFVIAEEIGTRRFTNAGYDHLYMQLKENIIKEFAQENLEISAAISTQKEIISKEKEETKQMEIQTQENRRKEKLEFLREKLAEDKRKNDLKERALQFKEKAIMELTDIFKTKSEIKGVKTETKKRLL